MAVGEDRDQIDALSSLRAKRSNPYRGLADRWIAPWRSLSSGAHSRDPLAPRNDELHRIASRERTDRSRSPTPGLKSLDHPGVDQEPVEAAGFRAALAVVEHALAAEHDVLLLL